MGGCCGIGGVVVEKGGCGGMGGGCGDWRL